MRKLLVTLLIPLAVACGSSDLDSLEAVASHVDCEIERVKEEFPIYKQEAAYCTDGRIVVWVPTAEAKGNYVEFANEFGAVPTEEGSNWVVF